MSVIDDLKVLDNLYFKSDKNRGWECETISEAIELIEKQDKALLKLDALEMCGVDNWEGYDDALNLFRSWKDEAE